MRSLSTRTLLVSALVLVAIGGFALSIRAAAAPPVLSMDQELVDLGYFEKASVAPAASCVPDGSVDDTLGLWSCCSGYAVSGSTVCTIPSDFGTTWKSCRHVCGTAPVGGCVPSGGWDDTLSITRCCSGSAVSGSTWCLNPADYGTTWKSCVQRCA